MIKEQPVACADVLVTWDFENGEDETEQELFVGQSLPLPFSESPQNDAGVTNNIGLPNNRIRTAFDNSKCSCTVDVVALVGRLGGSISKGDLSKFTAFLSQLRTVCGSDDTNLERSFIAMDWFVHQFGPNILRTVGYDWMATELEKTPKTMDHRTLERAINACSGATYFVEGACSHVFHAGYQAGEVLLEMKKSSIRSSGTFGRALGGAIATGASMISKFLAVGQPSCEPKATGFASLNAMGWNDLVDRLLNT